MRLYCVVMAGGAGTRLWPLSRRKSPKQTIPLAKGSSLFERAVARLKGLVPPEQTFVITSAALARTLSSMAPDLPRKNIISEPLGRDSAAAVFLGASIVAHMDKDALILVMPADHLISPAAEFHAAAQRAIRLAQKGFLVTFGIRPTRPSTAYGYIEAGRRVPAVKSGFLVKHFHEKPDALTARKYLRAGRYLWNSGLFVWKASTILAAARTFAPRHSKAILPLGALHGSPSFARSLSAAYAGLEKISIDYAVMEKAPNVAMIEADFEWTDVGSPLALRRFVKADAAGNVRLGLVDLLESTRCIAVSGDKQFLALFGCENLVVISTPDATLVCPAERAEELKTLVSRLERRPDAAKFL